MKRAMYRKLYWFLIDARKVLNGWIASVRLKAFKQSALASGATENQP